MDARKCIRQVERALNVLDDAISSLPKPFTAGDVPDITRLQYAHEHLLAAKTLLDQVAR